MRCLHLFELVALKLDEKLIVIRVLFLVHIPVFVDFHGQFKELEREIRVLSDQNAVKEVLQVFLKLVLALLLFLLRQFSLEDGQGSEKPWNLGNFTDLTLAEQPASAFGCRLLFKLNRELLKFRFAADYRAHDFVSLRDLNRVHVVLLVFFSASIISRLCSVVVAV